MILPVGIPLKLDRRDMKYGTMIAEDPLNTC